MSADIDGGPAARLHDACAAVDWRDESLSPMKAGGLQQPEIPCAQARRSAPLCMRDGLDESS